jgi:MFS superfamily sulfate permease-like transporter
MTKPDAPSPATGWRADLPSALVTFIVGVPLCLGIALASGAPLFAGIIAGVVGGLVAGGLSGSSLMVSGPAAGLTAIVLGGIQAHGFEGFLAAVVLAGLLQLGLAALRAGFIGYYFPTAVIRGMIVGIGLILVFKQIPHALGYDADAMGDETFLQANSENTFTALLGALRHIELGAVIISLVTFGVLLVWRRESLKRLRWLPGPLVAIVLGVLLNELFVVAAPSLALGITHLVTLPVPSDVAAYLEQLHFPAAAAFADPAIWRLAVVLAIVASLETLLSLEATDRLDRYKREASTDRELLAQGVGNVMSGVLGGLPIAGVVVRSAVNVEAGAISRRSAMMQGALLLAAVLLAPRILNEIPLAAVAVILIHLGISLANPRTAREELALGPVHAVPFTVTVMAILLTDLLIGIVVGLAVGVYFILRDHLQSPPFTTISPPGAVLRRLQLHDNLNFLHRAAMLTELQAVPDGSRLELDGRRTRRIDPDVLEVILNFREAARVRDIDYRLVGIPGADADATPPALP